MFPLLGTCLLQAWWLTFRLTHVRNVDISSVSASLLDTPWPLRFWQTTLSRSSIHPKVRSAFNLHTKNLQLDPLEPGDVAMPIVKSHDLADDGETLPPMPVIDPSELISRTFLMDKEDGQWPTSCMNPQCYRWIGDLQMYWWTRTWTLPATWIRTICLLCKGSRYNILIEWENGGITSEHLNNFGKDDPVTCAVYACEHGLLEEEGWKPFKGIVKREKKMICMVNQSHIKGTRNAPSYKFSYHIPLN
jgi:hypothetical protein